MLPAILAGVLLQQGAGGRVRELLREDVQRGLLGGDVRFGDGGWVRAGGG